MPRPHQINVLSDLKTLSEECDQIAEDRFKDGILKDWFEECQQVIIKIRDCSSVEDLKQIQYPVTINSFLGIETKKRSPKSEEVVGGQIEKIHDKKQVTVPNEVDQSPEKKEDKKRNLTPCDKVSHEIVTDKLMKNEEYSKLSAVVSHTPCNKVTVLKGSVVKKDKLMPPLAALVKNGNSDSIQIHDDKVNTPVLLNTTKNNKVLLQQMKTPVNFDATFVQTDSGAKDKSIKPQSNFDETFVKNDNGNNKAKSQLVTETPILNRTFNKVADETVIVDSVQKSKILKEVTHSGMLTRSGSKKMMMASSESNSSNGKLTRSGSKRKSSTSGSKKGSSKKQKLNSQETPVAVVSKASKAKNPLLKKTNSKSNLLLTPKSKSKVPAVIVPTVQSKTSIVSKEQQILEEIKKKEDKAKSNITRVLAERQQKAELNKKNLEEKRKKALEKRMQMEKEKEQRLRQESQGIKLNKDLAESAAKKTKTRELAEHNGKENKSMVSNSVKANDTYSGDTVVRTPVTKKSDDNDCYELTPISSNYNFSDDEEERQVGKPIPKWAQGVCLKSALMQQYYNPIDPIAVFGSHLDNPDLAAIFKLDKKSYKKRTSSAVWNSSYRC